LLGVFDGDRALPFTDVQRSSVAFQGSEVTGVSRTAAGYLSAYLMVEWVLDKIDTIFSVGKELML